MGLTIHGHQLARLDHDRAVAKLALLVELANPADDRDPLPRRLRAPTRDRRTVDRLRAVARLLGVLEHVAANAQLGQEHKRGPLRSGARDRVRSALSVELWLTDPGRELRTRDPDHAVQLNPSARAR